MKVNKTQALLYMYDCLISRGYITKEHICSEIKISNLTFLRYIQELRAYLCNFAPYQELVYSRNNEKFILITKKLI